MIFVRIGNNRLRKLSLALGLVLAVSAVSSCVRLKHPEIICPLPQAEGPAAVFMDDFPFVVSEETPNIDSVIPPTRLGCNVLLVMRGEDDFDLRKKLIRKARFSVALQTYIFSNDPVGRKIGSLLSKKNSKGLDVRLIVDAYTKLKPLDRSLYRDIERSGLNVYGFEPVYFMGMDETSVFWIDEVNQRFHEKYMIVDDEVAVVGGRNIADEYASFDDSPENQWRDQDVVLTGPVVQDIRRAFDENCEFFIEREKTRPPLVNPPWWGELWRKVTGSTPEEKQRDPSMFSSEFGFLDFTAENVPVRFIRSRPRLGETYIYQAYVYLIRTASRSVLIENAYFVPDRDILDALAGAAQRGVDVTIITNCDKTNDVFQMQPIVRHSYKPLIEAGAKVYEWQGIVPGHGSLHSKFAVIDGEICLVGSFNLDPRSKYLNSEDAVLIFSEAAAAELLDFVVREDLKNSRKISSEQADEWRNPKDLDKLFQLSFARALEDWW